MKEQIKKHDDNKSGFNPVAAVITGAVVGAGVAVAGAVALNDKKNLKKVKDVIANVKDKAKGYVEDIKGKAQDKKEEVEETIAEGKVKVQKISEIVKEPLDQEADEAAKITHIK